MELPPPPPQDTARRLLHGYADADLVQGAPLVIARLLEDGDSADLAWLCRTVPEAELASWLESRGGRQLSHRSRAFWQAVLGRPAGEESPVRRALWPL